ncbi:MAG: hypothetical protein DRP47_05630 [Candidatus Zixiibacteriota bacterium]|nr:MAG: hypothetical protein DRP47_05630 [candidate division Zixibacteria bacterium]
MTDTNNNENPMFAQLVLSLQMGAMQQMGKIASQLTGKVERNLSIAQASIDMLGMLESKTKGNLTEDEEKLLSHTLYELRMNFIDESKKSDQNDDIETAKSDDSNSEDKQNNQESTNNAEEENQS